MTPVGLLPTGAGWTPAAASSNLAATTGSLSVDRAGSRLRRMQHSTFISYAWVDNEVFPGCEKGWVDTFVDGLRKLLARELGRRDTAGGFWLDYEQLRGNQPLTPTIRSHLEASRTLVLMLSNGYLASPWCRQELAHFAQRAGADSGRVFVVEMSPVEQAPEPLRDLLPYRFWYLDEHRQPCTRWFPDCDPADREYPREQQRLARDLAAKLRAMAASSAVTAEIAPDLRPAQQPSPAVAYAPRAEPTAAATLTATAQPVADPTPTPTRPQRPQFVLVNGGSEDAELVSAIARRLEALDLDVAVPLSALPNQSGLKSSTLTRDLRDKLSLCDSVLMVYRQGPVDQVSQHLIECLKACAKAPKGKTPPAIGLCQTQPDSLALGVRTRGMRVRVVSGDCAEECIEWFLAESTA